MRVIVVGRGVIGLLTAVYCAAAGLSVTVVDQDDPGHPRAVSRDTHRAVRSLHVDDRALTVAAELARRQWDELGTRLEMPLVHRIGTLSALPTARIPAAVALLADAGVAARPLSPDDLAARYPRIRFPDGHGAVLEPAAGMVLADQVLVAVTDWLRRQPGVRVIVGRVVRTDAAGSVWLADGDTLHADRVVVAAGSWAPELLPAAAAARLTPHRQSTLYCRPFPDAAAWLDTPAIAALGTARGAWLAPPMAGTTIRMSAASASRVVSGVDGYDTPPVWRAHLVEHFAEILPEFDGECVVDARDSYYLADSATGGPVLMTVGEREWHFAACGGVSYKFAPLIARALARRAAGETPAPTGIAGVDVPQRIDTATSCG